MPNNVRRKIDIIPKKTDKDVTSSKKLCTSLSSDFCKSGDQSILLDNELTNKTI